MGDGRERRPGAARADRAAEVEGRLRKQLQVYLTAWQLSPQVDDDRVAAHRAALTDDMRGF